MALANTGTLQTNFNVDPYYDDYDESKNFHRVLFKPGLAVQARELTQLQTILQNQIDRFGEHVFKEGSVVRGNAVSVDDKIQWVRLLDEQSGTTVDVSDFLGKSITGGTSGLTAVVLDTADGVEASLPDTKTLFVKTTNSGSNSSVKIFRSGETITSNTGVTATLLSANASGYGYQVVINEGILFAKDHFIRADRQSIIASKYNNRPSVRVGYTIDEEIVSFTDDNTLLDPAQGAYNYAAPGADRLKLTPTIKVLNEGESITDNFIERVVVEDGFIKEKYDKTVYSAIRDYLAERTYDESGDYIVSGLNLTINEHLQGTGNRGIWSGTTQNGNTALLAAGVSPGKGYVSGYDFDILKTYYVNVEKGIDIESIEGTTQYANIGNYVVVDQLLGDFDYDEHKTVQLHDVAANAVLESAKSAGVSPPASQIGSAKIRGLEWQSGVKGSFDARYRMYLYDVQMTANSFAHVRSIYTPTSPASYADVVLQDGVLGFSNTAALEDTNLNSYLINLPAEDLVTDTSSYEAIDSVALENQSYQTKRHITGTWSSTTGTVGIGDLSGASFVETASQQVGSSGVRTRWQITSDQSVEAKYALDTSATRDAGSNTFVLSGATAPSAYLNIGDQFRIVGDTANSFVVSAFRTGNKVDVSGPTRTFGSSGTVVLKKVFRAGQVIPLADGFGDAPGGNNTVQSDRSITMGTVLTGTGSEPTIDLVDIPNGDISVNVSVVVEKDPAGAKTKLLRDNRYVKISMATHGITGPYPLGVPDVFNIKNVYLKKSDFTGNASDLTDTVDVTRFFALDTNQTDNYYGTSKIKLLPGLTLEATDYLMVKFDYFEVSGGGNLGYFSVDSYPLNDVNTASDEIRSEQLPVYINSNGDRIKLRDVVDFRPYTSNTVYPLISSSPATTVPTGVSTTINGVGGLDSIHADKTFNTDVSFNLPRKDLVIINKNGLPSVIQGVPSLNPQTPRHNMNDGLLLATIDIPAYPSMSPYYATKQQKTPDGVRVKQNRQVRFTMRDIGTLKQRIENIEYYSSLNLLEKSLTDLQIADVNGINRFKNGFFVDPLRGHSYADVTNRDHTAAVSKVRNELSPAELNFDVNMDVDLSGSSNYKQKGDFIFIDYDEVLMQEQPFATTSTLLSALNYQYNGVLVLDPPSDYFNETKIAPDRNVTLDSGMGEVFQDISDGIKQVAESTELVNSGVSQTVSGNKVKTTLTETFETTDVDIEVTSGIQSAQHLGDFVIDTSLIPYMRSIEIKFKATGMKPGARLQPYFDGFSVTNDVLQTDTNYSILSTQPFENTGGGVKAASADDDIATGYKSGEVYGIFTIPAARFHTGGLIFSLTDNPLSATQDNTTFASAKFTSHGLSSTTQSTSVSTVEYDIDFDVTKTLTTSKTTKTTKVPAPPPVYIEVPVYNNYDPGNDWDGAGDAGCGADPNGDDSCNDQAGSDVGGGAEL